MAKKTKTTKPSGLSITRSGNTYTLKWKQGGSDYKGGQKLELSVNGGKWTNKAVSKTDTSSSYSDSNGTLKTLAFRVCGKKKDTTKKKYAWSAWVPSPTWTATKPKISEFKYSNVAANCGTFSWKAPNDKDTTAILTKVEAQTCYVRGTAKPGANAWGSIMTKGASGSQTITEESENIAAGNLVRWYRVRAVGHTAKADSDWQYKSHAYGTPTAPVLTSASAKAVSGSATQITAEWNDSYNSLKPIDILTLQYVIAVPTNTARTAPATGWDDAIEIKPNGSRNKVVVNVSDAIGIDECLWVRIKSEHDGNPSYSNARVAQTGKLKAPTIDASANTTTGAVSITITEETSCAVANTAIFFRSEKNPSNDRIVAILPAGTTTTAISVPAIIGASRTCFGAYAFLGTYSGLSIKATMTSTKVIDSDIAAVAPANVRVSEGPRDGTVRIGWEWSWTGATKAELAWADHEEAWESTAEPNYYTVINNRAVSWVVADLEVGKRWYFRVRLIGTDDESGEEVSGPWSTTVMYDLSSVPDKPVLTLSKNVINQDDTVTARWVYSSEGAEQAYAEICILTYDENDQAVYSDPIAHVDVGQSAEISMDWSTGETYNLVVRITTKAEVTSAWSDPATLYIAEPVSIALSASSITAPSSYTITTATTETTYVDGVEDSTTTQSDTDTNSTSGTMTSAIYADLNLDGTVDTTVSVSGSNAVVTENARSVSPNNYEPTITAMPFTATITGAGDTGTTILTIVRAEDYHLDRPDERDYDGYAGETIASYSQQGEAAITITVDDLVGSLDDGAKYLLKATVIDEFEQTADLEIPFTVDWAHKADVPGVTIQMDNNQRVAEITPIAPEGYASGDVCDIYRLTADRPELVFKGAAFGTTYVDPYPAFGDFCGHRLVTRTANGDYATAGGIGWYDAGPEDGDLLVEKRMVIDVDGDQIELPYNIELANSWNKDFERTEYLGGSVQGDWNPAVTRDLSAKTVLLRGRDLDQQLAMRDLADYAGPAHIRTPDGSSFTCDIQVREAMDYKSKRVSYSLTVRAVDPEEPDGMTLAEWNAMNNE